jgi:hypothetical protein
MKSTIEALTVPRTCSQTPADGKAAIKALAAYSAAVSQAFADARAVFAAIPDPNANTDAAEHGVVDPMIAALEAKRVSQGWAACP